MQLDPDNLKEVQSLEEEEKLKYVQRLRTMKMNNAILQKMKKSIDNLHASSTKDVLKKLIDDKQHQNDLEWLWSPQCKQLLRKYPIEKQAAAIKKRKEQAEAKRRKQRNKIQAFFLDCSQVSHGLERIWTLNHYRVNTQAKRKTKEVLLGPSSQIRSRSDQFF